MVLNFNGKQIDQPHVHVTTNSSLVAHLFGFRSDANILHPITVGGGPNARATTERLSGFLRDCLFRRPNRGLFGGMYNGLTSLGRRLRGLFGGMYNSVTSLGRRLRGLRRLLGRGRAGPRNE